ncbi:aspartyl-phosphate phosphatase Spo0E family protein [Brevibacillus humidisoli]|uniref:aspartyl-phosphate phosphatase Spo0E family protein n=1 Tax=Brevibacillus humidisoli TaxID=2895522 RepID=UPI001E4168F6|nr:aspartyl-phosphate phosphatase Spo0E family protein [Brevibacillus humidisoli]UFJ42270.1 aspartyl-phosphate phosphatase Spo0E family protein [Brevibacillus humidisoli]
MDTRKAIEELRAYLEKAVQRLDYDLLNPEILKISQELDQLIVAQMVHGNR